MRNSWTVKQNTKMDATYDFVFTSREKKSNVHDVMEPSKMKEPQPIKGQIAHMNE